MQDRRLRVTTPRHFTTERDYVISVLLSEFLGLEFSFERHDEDIVSLATANSDGRIDIPDVLFANAQTTNWAEAPLPVEPLIRLDHGHTDIIALYGGERGRMALSGDGEHLELGCDIFGGTFYLLTRLEEFAASSDQFDAHGRYPSAVSLLAREALVERPIVDEYLGLLCEAMDRLWPGLASPVDRYRLVVTHDIDHPMGTYGQALKLVLRRTGGDILRRRDPGMAWRRLKTWLTGDIDSDPNNTFDWLMDRSEEIGAVSRFHFMAATPARYDSGYDIGAEYLKPILARIEKRGHEIGLHPSYRSSVNTELFATEVGRLETAVEAAEVAGWSHKSRQHYLRWNVQSTWRHLDAAGITVDSSLGFAELPGFRCGTSRAFSTFDLTTSTPLNLVEEPLIVMDATLLGKNYLSLEWEDAVERAASIAAICRRHNTPFTLLWHNDKVLSSLEKQRYAGLLSRLK